MHGTGNLTVNRTRCNLFFLPDVLCVLRSTFQESLCTERFTILHQSQLGHFVCQIVDIFSFVLYAPLFCQADQFFRIFYMVASVWICLMQGVADFTAVIGMSCRTACCETQEVTSYNTVYVTSADTSGCFRGNTARSHRTDTAAGSLLSEFTVRGLVLYTELPRISTNFGSVFQKLIGSLFEFFYAC